MGRHRPKWLCVVCGRVRVPGPGMVCFRCSQRLPGLPRPCAGARAAAAIPLRDPGRPAKEEEEKPDIVRFIAYGNNANHLVARIARDHQRRKRKKVII